MANLIGVRRALLSGGGGWTPLNLGASLIGWWDAADLTVPGGVAAWVSRVGGWSVTQATGGLQPVWSATGWDGIRPCLTGNGTPGGQILNSATGPYAEQLTLVVVAERAVQGDDAGSGHRPLVTSRIVSTLDAAFVSVQRPSLDAAQTSVSVNLGSGVTISQSSGFGIGGKAVLAATFSTASVGVSVNGSAPTSGAPATAGADASAFSLFGDLAGTAARRFAGKIAEVMVLNAVADAATLARLQGYAAWKWGIQTLLPSGHPYRDRRP